MTMTQLIETFYSDSNNTHHRKVLLTNGNSNGKQLSRLPQETIPFEPYILNLETSYRFLVDIQPSIIQDRFNEIIRLNTNINLNYIMKINNKLHIPYSDSLVDLMYNHKYLTGLGLLAFSFKWHYRDSTFKRYIEKEVLNKYFTKKGEYWIHNYWKGSDSNLYNSNTINLKDIPGVFYWRDILNES